MPRTIAEKRQIHRKAKKLLGQRYYDPMDREEYIRQCVEDMMQSGETDEFDDAQLICETMFLEEQDLEE